MLSMYRCAPWAVLLAAGVANVVRTMRVAVCRLIAGCTHTKRNMNQNSHRQSHAQLGIKSSHNHVSHRVWNRANDHHKLNRLTSGHVHESGQPSRIESSHTWSGFLLYDDHKLNRLTTVHVSASQQPSRIEASHDQLCNTMSVTS